MEFILLYMKYRNGKGDDNEYNYFFYRNGVVAHSASRSKNCDAALCVNVFFWRLYAHIWKPSLKIPAYATEILYSLSQRRHGGSTVHGLPILRFLGEM